MPAASWGDIEWRDVRVLVSSTTIRIVVYIGELALSAHRAFENPYQPPSPTGGTDKLTAAERQSQDEKIRIAVQTPPVPSGDHSTCGLALLLLQLELP